MAGENTKEEEKRKNQIFLCNDDYTGMYGYNCINSKDE